MNITRPPHISTVLLLLACLANSALAQTPEYVLTRLGRVPGSYITMGKELNDHGDVVGWAQFSASSPALRAWTWSAQAGMTVLPQPSGMSEWSASDINNSGVIAGDGGGDFGLPWRYTNGTYEMLGTISGYGAGSAESINESGAIAGTLKSGSFTNPRLAYLAEAGQPMSLIASEAYAHDINDAGQIVGSGAPILPGGGPGGYRYTPGVGILSFGPVSGRIRIRPNAINAAGDVVGVAFGATGGSSIPFIYTESGGMQEIGNYGSHAGAIDINGLREVVGTAEQGTTDGWIWTEQDGVEILNTLYVGWQTYTLLYVHAINERGQILIQVYDQQTNDSEPALLTPIDGCRAVRYCDAAPNSAGSGALIGHTGNASLATGNFVLNTTGAPASTVGIYFYGTGQARVPIGDGFMCVGGSAFRLYPAVATDAAGNATRPVDFTAPPSPAGRISAGTTWSFQFWYRDLPGFGSGSGVNFSNGLRVRFCD